MATRIKPLGMDSFFGSLVYERVVLRDHLWVKQKHVIEAYASDRVPSGRN